MHWGNKITLVFIGFVILIVSMVIFSTQQEFDMVEENYYEEEIAYQGKMDEIKNGNEWNGTVSVKQESNNLALLFEGADKVKGKVKFFRASDANLDFFIPISEEVNIPVEKFKAGNWKVSFSWEAEGKKYFKEEQIFIQR
ncbi:FixH family protein [Marivirga salinae]|uniref:FixH family protein n=1 Tax=Marivirga salinarum TaxID=3059078 RepID=A0AA51NAH5_9BACT|nr:FixH family protein [Marivirga sp. BDSF4-3]WMN11826.1 FixH family protein [Marivirga sp. BDSF4-3]